MAHIGIVYPEADEALARRVSALITQKIPDAEIIHIAYEDNLAGASMAFDALVVLFSPDTSPVQRQRVLDFVDRTDAPTFAVGVRGVAIPTTLLHIALDELLTAAPTGVIGRFREREGRKRATDWLDQLSRALQQPHRDTQSAIPPLRGGIPAGYGQEEKAETDDRKRDEGVSRSVEPPPFQSAAPEPPNPVSPIPAPAAQPGESTIRPPRPITPSPAPDVTDLLPPQAGEGLDEFAAGEAFDQPSDEPGGGGNGGIDPVLFSAYAPRECKPMDWQPMKVYAFRETAGGQVEADAKAALGARFADYRPTTGTSAVPVAEGALITVTPDVPGVQFNPPSASVSFFEEWHRLDFKLRANTAPLQQAANGRITFMVEGVIAADVPLSLYVTDQPAQTVPAMHAAKPYRAVFCSYSHADTPIVERVERAIRTLGYDYLRDVKTLRSGEDWNAGLLAMIDRADIFQLFWSDRAAASKYVRQEWEYALARAVREGIPSFIRPVYWQKPMPGVPPELGHIHFAPDETLDDGLGDG